MSRQAQPTLRLSLAVIGGGVIGLSCAWRAAQDGAQVTVFDPAPGSGASGVAGGMLAPVTEAWPGDEQLLAMGAAAVGRWRGFADELAGDSGQDPGLRTNGTVAVAVDPGDRAELDRLADYLHRLGRSVEQLSGRDLRRLEPSLGPMVRRGLSVPGDYSVDNRALLAALRAACERRGVRFRSECLDGVEGIDELPADAVLVAAGAHSGSLHPTLRRAIRPVKGEILRLRARRGTLPPPTRTVRATVGARPCYLVPRDDDEVVLGATQQEVGFDTDVTAGGVRDLINDAEHVVPGIGEYELRETRAGLRPASPDNLPVVGWLADGLLAATGHHRNGMLLAPLTAEGVAALLGGKPVPGELAAADPARLADARSRGGTT